jgi:hypothetical protein
MTKTPDGVADAAENGDAILLKLAEEARVAFGGRGLVTMIVNEDNSFRYFATGLSHAQINNALAMGIHMNMNDHDRKAEEAARQSVENQGERG